MLLCPVFFRKVSLFWEGSLEKWISKKTQRKEETDMLDHITVGLRTHSLTSCRNKEKCRDREML